MLNSEQLQNELKEISKVKDPLDFFYRFLRAYEIPRATIARLSKEVENGEPIYISNKIYYQFTLKTNLFSFFNVLKESDLKKINTRFIILANRDSLLVYDQVTKEIFNTLKSELYMNYDFFFPLIGKEKKSNVLFKSVDLKAAEKFAQLYNELIISNKDMDNKLKNIENLMSRLLFCFFADSTGLIPSGKFHNLLYNYGDGSGNELKSILEDIFRVIFENKRKNLSDSLKELPFFNIIFFNFPTEVPVFNKKSTSLLLEISELDWSKISPDILGTLIQSIVSNETDNTVVHNYTSISNIYKLIVPLFLDELYEEYENLKKKENEKDYKRFLKKISEITIFDPACFTGNFLIVVYKELKSLEYKVLNILESNVDFKRSEESYVETSQFFGIEMNYFANLIAKLGLFFTKVQMQKERYKENVDLSSLVKDLNDNNITHGNPTRISWESLIPSNKENLYIIGNPPYKGSRRQTNEQKADLGLTFNEYNNYSNLDYASCWFLLAAKLISNSNASCAFVTTNSLTQGQQVDLLWSKIFENNVHISFAHTVFKWKNSSRNNTAVSVVIIGLRSNHKPKKKFIYTQDVRYEVSWINPYLTGGDVIVKEERHPISNLPYMHKGNMPYDGGHLLLTPVEKEEIIKDFPNSNKFFKRVMGSEEFIHSIERWCIWIKDEELEEALSIPPINNRIEFVKKERLNKSDKNAQKLASRPHQFREVNETISHSLIIPSVSSENRALIPIGFVDQNTIITNLAFAIYNCEPWVFGLLSSKLHNLWIRTVCGGLETRLRYSSRLGYNTFPFPDISEAEKVAITECVYNIIEEREKQVGKTMAQLYDKDTMDEGLIYAHNLLDNVVENCYRKEPYLSDQERLEHLFKLYKERGR